MGMLADQLGGEAGKVPGRVTTAQEPLKYTSIMEVNGDRMREMISTGREPGFGDKGTYPKGAFVVMGKLIMISIISGQMVVAPSGCESWRAGGLL